MADIVERLRLYAQQFEDQHAPDQITLAMRAGADEIDRKKAEIASLLNTLADARTESMRLRAANRILRLGLNGLIDSNDATEIADAIAAGEAIDWDRYPPTARAALEGRT